VRRSLTAALAPLLVVPLGMPLLAAGPARSNEAGPPAPGSPAYVARDLENVAAAYGRVTGLGGQLGNPAYLPALVAQTNQTSVDQLLQQVAAPTRPALSAGNVFPGWNVGNPLRAGWNGTRGLARKVAFTNRYGALLRGTVYRPLDRARDPYTGKRLRAPFPGVVITPGSVQGSEGMYAWLAEDLAERGYVVLTYDVQGQGTSETLPHTTSDALPFCNPFAPPLAGEMMGCPGVPFQQLSNFVVGTEDAIDFFTSTARHPYRNPGSAGASVDAHNPFAAYFDRRRDRHTVTRGRTTKLAIIGHSMGAAAVSKVQGTDRRVEAVVALDKLSADGSFAPGTSDGANKPVVPALAVQSEYGFTVNPYTLAGGSSLVPAPTQGNAPDPRRERRTGFDGWAEAGVDSMLVVPRASTHLEYTDIPLVLPASRYGQDLASVYVQRWLDRYLKHQAPVGALLRKRFSYLEPVGGGRWAPVRLQRDPLLSFYYCSAYSLRGGKGLRSSGDVTGVGC
jgi:alpha-beta hydrolase superfamily lysophospholipase